MVHLFLSTGKYDKFVNNSLFQQIPYFPQQFRLLINFFDHFFLCFFLSHFTDETDDDENGKSDDQKIDDRLDENSVFNFDFTDVYSKRSEVYSTQQEADGRHQYVIDQRRDDIAKGGADDDPNSKIDDIALGNERFKRLPHVPFSFRVWFLKRFTTKNKRKGANMILLIITDKRKIEHPKLSLIIPLEPTWNIDTLKTMDEYH